MTREIKSRVVHSDTTKRGTGSGPTGHKINKSQATKKIEKKEGGCC
jgi:hypothetical protein